MNFSIEALTVLLYLTPGLFASMLMDLVLVRQSSDNRDEGMLYLTDAAWYDQNGVPEYSDLHGVFLVKKDNIDFIEFTQIDKHRADKESARR